MTMTRRQKTLVGLAGAHLVLVGLGASSIGLRRWTRAMEPLALYSDLSGASSGYGFFAPGIGTHLRARFELTGADGSSRAARLESGSSHEADLRVGNIIGVFWEHTSEEKLRRSLAASWTGKVLARHPGSRKAVMRLESYYLPSMDEWRQGARGGWEPFYQAAFVPKQAKGESK